jgi:hypothetical protein
MTTKPTDDILPITKAEPQIRAAFKVYHGLAPQLAISTPPGVAVPLADAPHDLEARVVARRTEIIAKLVALKDDTRQESAEARDKLKAKLSEVAHIIKEGVVDGWVNLGDVATHKLKHWLTS